MGSCAIGKLVNIHKNRIAFLAFHPLHIFAKGGKMGVSSKVFGQDAQQGRVDVRDFVHFRQVGAAYTPYGTVHLEAKCFFL